MVKPWPLDRCTGTACRKDINRGFVASSFASLTDGLNLRVDDLVRATLAPRGYRNIRFGNVACKKTLLVLKSV